MTFDNCVCGHTKRQHYTRKFLTLAHQRQYYNIRFNTWAWLSIYQPPRTAPWCKHCDSRCVYKLDTTAERYIWEHPPQRDARLPLESTLTKRMVAHPDWYK